MSDFYGSDAYSPAEIARRIEAVGETKARMATLPLVLLGVLGGAVLVAGVYHVIYRRQAATRPDF
jgi:formate/nitrite transporter FocA (FNT family)